MERTNKLKMADATLRDDVVCGFCRAGRNPSQMYFAGKTILRRGCESSDMPIDSFSLPDVACSRIVSSLGEFRWNSQKLF